MINYKSVLSLAIGITVFGVLSLNACKNAKSEKNENATNEKLSKAAPVIATVSSTNASATKTQLDKAKKAKKTVFLVVTGKGAKTETITKIANDASKQVKQSMVIQMNRDDAANAALVKELQVSGAPIPLVLVIANNGLTVMGFVEQDASVTKLVDAVPSPKMLEVMTALKDGKTLFIIAYKSTAKDKKQVNTNCLKACADVKTAVTIEINIEDKVEAKFLKQLGIDMTKSITTLVVNPSGQITGTYTGIPDATKLIADAKKVVKSGCGSGSSCGSTCK